MINHGAGVRRKLPSAPGQGKTHRKLGLAASTWGKPKQLPRDSALSEQFTSCYLALVSSRKDRADQETQGSGRHGFRPQLLPDPVT